MKDMNKQIEEIVQGIYSTYGTGALYKRNRDRTYKDYDGELEKDDADKLYNDIYALIQKEREEAVREFVLFLSDHYWDGINQNDLQTLFNHLESCKEMFLSQTKGGEK
jgi:hypothetical protein